MAEDKLTVRNDLSEIRGLSKFTGLFCDANGLQALEHRLALVLEELFTNIVSYGYEDVNSHEINVQIKLDGGVLTAIIDDDGIPFDPQNAQVAGTEGSVEDRPVGGLGIHLVFTIVDAFNYERVDGRNLTTVTMTVPEL
jgi:serine/threonine-protein kinase RsbW